MSLSPKKMKLTKETLDNYIQRFDSFLHFVPLRGSDMNPSEPYGVLGHYYELLIYLKDTEEENYYKCNFDELIKKTYDFVSGHNDYGVLLDNDLKTMLANMNNEMNLLKKEWETEGLSVQSLFGSYGRSIFEYRNGFEYVFIGLECTGHFTVSQSVLKGLRSFDKRFREFISCVESQTEHVILEDPPAPNPLNSRFWWRYR